jgi:hypothetical protein
VQHEKATWIVKTAPVQHKKDSLDFCLSRLSFLCCTGTFLSIQVVFFIFQWYCFIYPGCHFDVALVLFFVYQGCLLKKYQCNIKKTTWIDKTAPVQHKKATWKDKTVPVQHKKDNLEKKQHQCNIKRQPG